MLHHELPDAIDLSHHLSKVARARVISPLKELQKYLGRSDIISLAGGLPHPDLFPVDELSANVYSQDAFPTEIPPTKPSLVSWITRLFSGRDQNKWDKLKVPRYPKQSGDINLATLLQYGLSTGSPQLQEFIKEFTSRVYKPAYGNWSILVHAGNTDGWMKAVMTLCDPGDVILTCEWTYPSAVATAHPLGIKPIPVPIDGEGMRSDALFEILSTWDEVERGAKRPRVMYTVPVGQNPTGATMHAQRKKEIYKNCVQFDVIIVEDDPYYFLQEGPYVPRKDRPVYAKANMNNEGFLTSLVPSYLSLDYQGRVVRLDTFSKTIAPGCRLGWFTCNPLFAERFERQGETSTQAPCGFGQAVVASLLMNWKFDGYVRWLQGLRAQYRERRNFCLDCFGDFFELEARSTASTAIYDGYIKTKPIQPSNKWTEEFVHREKRFPVFSFVPPTSGMFVWLQINFRDHSSFGRLGHKNLERRLMKEFAEAGVLIGPGFFFDPNMLDDANDEGPGHFRLSFSNEDFAVLRKAIGIMATVLEAFFYGGDRL
ncbi:PLP-dependent transferase [Macrolepiota fuliginosa MF-IS2]|uniref:PLP-dependent transferase n=1 Tax=Macrolepiota fuliginosa MF-IS2 TaxID=1400762 RepID=A0A9P6C7X0_9AGAR|nr:PLP-dependent transferase [Macrolepiota fuliginosa MF-IS2]